MKVLGGVGDTTDNRRSRKRKTMFDYFRDKAMSVYNATAWSVICDAVRDEQCVIFDLPKSPMIGSIISN